MPEIWQRLHLSNQGPIPRLLFKYSPTASSYELYVTDLTYIWSERLDRKAVLKRADDDDTTIDPSEDSEQFKILLQKIGECLRNEPGSNTVLNHKSQGNAHDLELAISSKLPAPLKPLRWRLHLSKEPQSSTTSHLLLHFIKAESDREARQQSLIGELSKKDWVLAKLFDKIETMGIDLSNIFPGTSGLRTGRKGPTREQAGKYIKGVAPFNEQAWLEDANKSSPSSGLAANIVAEILGGSENPQELDGLKPPPDEWWGELTTPGSPTTASTPPKHSTKTSGTNRSPEAMETFTETGEATEEDEFERQATPPRLKPPIKTAKKAHGKEHEDTQSEEEDVAKPKEKKKKTIVNCPPSAMRPKNRAIGKAKGGLGTIGKQTKQKDPSPSLSTPETTSPTPPPREHESPLNNNDEDETTDGETVEEPPKPQTQSTSKEQAKPAAKTSRGLGVIGGKKKKVPEPDPDLEPETVHEKSQSSEPEATPKKRKPLRKLGVIGGQKARPIAEPRSSLRTETVSPPPTQKTQDEENEGKKFDRGSADDQDSMHELPSLATDERESKKGASAELGCEETEQEKADRKRDELKRQLEAKSKAPRKKKRRF